jgi:hypothetical protein
MRTAPPAQARSCGSRSSRWRVQLRARCVRVLSRPDAPQACRCSRCSTWACSCCAAAAARPSSATRTRAAWWWSDARAASSRWRCGTARVSALAEKKHTAHMYVTHARHTVMLHPNSNSAGYLDVENCRLHDVLPSTFWCRARGLSGALLAQTTTGHRARAASATRSSATYRAPRRSTSRARTATRASASATSRRALCVWAKRVRCSDLLCWRLIARHARAWLAGAGPLLEVRKGAPRAAQRKGPKPLAGLTIGQPLVCIVWARSRRSRSRARPAAQQGRLRPLSQLSALAAVRGWRVQERGSMRALCARSFPCCGKAFPCPLCHDKGSDHEGVVRTARVGVCSSSRCCAQWATRMICGKCSREQPFSNTRNCACGQSVRRASVRLLPTRGGAVCVQRQASLGRWLRVPQHAAVTSPTADPAPTLRAACRPRTGTSTRVCTRR